MRGIELGNQWIQKLHGLEEGGLEHCAGMIWAEFLTRNASHYGHVIKNMLSHYQRWVCHIIREHQPVRKAVFAAKPRL